MANSTRLLAQMSSRYDSALNGHALPFERKKLIIEGGYCGKFSGPVFATNGFSVPISRGSPPFFDV